MNQDPSQRAMQVFEAVCDMPAAERQAAAQRLCEGDSAVMSRVLAMLRADAGGGTRVLDGSGARLLAGALARETDFSSDTSPGAAPRAVEGESTPLPLLTGNYRVIRVIGEGGMGTVFEAQQAAPRRMVALKAVRPGLASRRMLRRLAREADVLGRLHHPGIAQVYEAGAPDEQTPDRAYFAMELVRGKNLRDHAREKGLPARQILELVAKVCDAVEHAHQRGVIHCDLKPGNILVNEDGQPKVLDFGISRVIGADEEATAHHTAADRFAGTMPYMSPEQAQGGDEPLDTRTDIYAIGVILYECLSGRLPIDLADCSLPTAVRRICEARPERLGQLRPELSGDIETIVARAMDADPARRYQSAGELALDIRRHLEGLPILARSDSAFYVLRRQMHRHRTMLLGGLAALVALVVFGVHATLTARREAAARLEAEEARTRAQLQSARADEAAEKFERELAISVVERARLMLRSGNFLDAENQLWVRLAQDKDPSKALWALRELYDKYPCEASVEYGVWTGGASTITYNRDGSRMLLSMMNGEWLLADAHDGSVIRRVRGHDGNCNGVAFLPRENGDEWIITTGGDGMLRVWHGETGEKIREVRAHEIGFTALAARGDWIATGNADGAVRLWNAGTLELIDEAPFSEFGPSPHWILSLDIDPRGELIAVGQRDGAVFTWRPGCEAGDEVGPPPRIVRYGAHKGDVACLRFDDTGSRMASVSADRNIHMYVRDRSEPAKVGYTGNGAGTEICFFDGGRRLAASGYWRVDVLDAETLEPVGPRDRFASSSQCVAVSPDSQRMAVMSGDGRLRLWRLTDPQDKVVLNEPGAASLGASPDGRVLVVGGLDNSIGAWAAPEQTGGAWQRLWKHATRAHVRYIHFSRDGGRFITASQRDVVEVRDTATGSLIRAITVPNAITNVAMLIEDGTRAVIGTRAGSVSLWDCDTGRMISSHNTEFGEVLGLAVSPDGAVLAATHRGRAVTLWSIPGVHRIGHFMTPSMHWYCDFSTDGAMLASGDWVANVIAWDWRMGRPLTVMRGHSELAATARFDDDSGVLLTTSSDGSVRVWDPRRGIELMCLDATGIETWDVIPIPGTSLIATAYREQRVEIRDLRAMDQRVRANAGARLQRAGSILGVPLDDADRDRVMRWLDEQGDGPAWMR